MVTDASVWVNYFLPKNRWHQESREWLEVQLSGGRLLVAPELLLVELGGAVSRATGRPELGRRAIRRLRSWPGLDVVSGEQSGLEAALLACDLGLRGADTFYVLLARQRAVPLISWDDDQRERARAVVPVARPGEPLLWPGAGRQG
jgi:predicted nucleic acid-binding protein